MARTSLVQERLAVDQWLKKLKGRTLEAWKSDKKLELDDWRAAERSL